VNHDKADCIHSDKECSVCGKVGHIWRVCRKREGAQDEKKKEAAPAGDECEPCLAIPWPCMKCSALSYNQKLQKCEKQSCGAKRVQAKTDPKPQKEKTLISKGFQNRLEDAKEVVVIDDGKEDSETVNLQKMLILAKEAGWADVIDDTQKKLDAHLLKKQSHQPSSATAAATSLSAAATERNRIITQDATWREQLAKKILWAEAEIERHKEQKELHLKEEDDRHVATKKALVENYDLFASNEEEALLKLKDDAEKQNKLVEEALAVVNEQLKDNFPTEKEKEEPKEPPANTQKVSVVSSDMLTKEVVAQHMAMDRQNLDGMTEEQGLRVMTSMFSLFNSLAEQKERVDQFHVAQDAAFATGAQLQQQPALQPQQQSPSGEDGFTTVGKDGKPVKQAAPPPGGGAAAKAPEPMDDEVTSEWELTDTEDEMTAVNEGRPPVKKKMKDTTRSEQKTIKEKRGARKQQQGTGKVIQ
jgi:hypothetical protein